MEITVNNDVQLTAKTMSVTYRRERVLVVNQDGRAQFVIHVRCKLQILCLLQYSNFP